MLQTCSYQLRALLITRKNWRHRTTRTVHNTLGEVIPFAMVLTRGAKDAEKGWTARPKKLHWLSGKTYLNRISRTSRADVISGWGRGLTVAESRERYSRHGSIIPGNHLDNHFRFGISVKSWARLRWGKRWARPAVRGWSGRAVSKWYFATKLQDQSPEDKWSVGCPCWYLEHQP